MPIGEGTAWFSGVSGLQQCLRDTVDASYNSSYYIHIVKAADRVGQSHNINDMDVAGGLVGYKGTNTCRTCICVCVVVRRGEDWQRPKSQHQISGTVTKVHRTNPGTEAEPQQIVAQGYSHAYSTTFHS